MARRPLLAVALAAAAAAGCRLPALAAPPSMAEKAVDEAGFSPLPDKPGERAVPEIVKSEVLLDRARFSPGAIDGIDGENFRHALYAYQVQMALPASGKLDQATWDKLTAGAPSPLRSVEVTKAEAEGPFTRTIPADFEEQSKLKRMGYHDIREELGERYHMSEPLLMALNPGSKFAVGQRIVVTDVDEAKPTDKVVKIVVDKVGHDVEALAADGRLVAYYPASIGSEEKPAPTGDFTIHRVDRDPVYTYDPKYHFKGVSAKEPFSIKPGPNNPVGLVWMDLGGDGYGIHGTPDPEAVGKTQSHGCIRMTNWDALNLASMVDKGTAVSFGEVQGSTGPVQSAPAAAPVPGVSAAPVPTSPASGAGAAPGQPSASASAPAPLRTASGDRASLDPTRPISTIADGRSGEVARWMAWRRTTEAPHRPALRSGERSGRERSPFRRRQALRSAGTWPPFSDSFFITSACSHTFIAAESSMSPV